MLSYEHPLLVRGRAILTRDANKFEKKRDIKHKEKKLEKSTNNDFKKFLGF